jgi:hypothetical protein
MGQMCASDGPPKGGALLQQLQDCLIKAQDALDLP